MNFQFASFETITGMPDFIGYIFVFALGAVVGSFLNVVIHRVPLEESIVFPNSTCPKCKNPILPFDNIPILSWLILGGKCRNCKEKISPRYPAVELLTALAFVLTFFALGFTPFLPVGLIFAATMIALIFIDAENMILPDVINFPLLGLALIVRVVYPIFFGNAFFSDLTHSPLTTLNNLPLWLVSLIGAIFGALLGGGSLWLIGKIWEKLRDVEAMGLGDVKMMFAVGALLGWRLTFLTLFLGAFSGAIIGVFWIFIQNRRFSKLCDYFQVIMASLFVNSLEKKKNAKSKIHFQTFLGIGIILNSMEEQTNLQAKIPFGIFLGIGSFIALLFGEQIIQWYLKTFVPQ